MVFLRFDPNFETEIDISPSSSDPAVGISIRPGTPNVFREFLISYANDKGIFKRRIQETKIIRL